MPIIVFLTDGMPTEGVTSTAVIRENVLQANKVNASVFSIAFGDEYDYDFDFLQALSLENRGTAVYFEPTSEAAEGINAISMRPFPPHLYPTLSFPMAETFHRPSLPEEITSLLDRKFLLSANMIRMQPVSQQGWTETPGAANILLNTSFPYKLLTAIIL